MMMMIATLQIIGLLTTAPITLAQSTAPASALANCISNSPHPNETAHIHCLREALRITQILPADDLSSSQYESLDECLNGDMSQIKECLNTSNPSAEPLIFQPFTKKDHTPDTLDLVRGMHPETLNHTVFILSTPEKQSQHWAVAALKAIRNPSGDGWLIVIRDPRNPVNTRVLQISATFVVYEDIVKNKTTDEVLSFVGYILRAAISTSR